MSRALSRIVHLLAFVCLVLLVAGPARGEAPRHAAIASGAHPGARADSVISPVPDWSVVATTEMLLGISVDTAGDVNGDGYDDVLVGAPYYQIGWVGGAAMVYHGSESGPSTTPDWMETGYGPAGNYGRRVAAAGDVNDDGYDDVLVRDRYVDAGRVSLYYGSASGLSISAAWSGSGPISPPASLFGWSIDSAGDVNGDGYDDVIVGDPNYDADFSLGGAVFIYYGSESGLQVLPDWEFRSPVAGARLGWSVSAAGDVNDDGFDDFLVGAPEHPIGTGRRRPVLSRARSARCRPENVRVSATTSPTLATWTETATTTSCSVTSSGETRTPKKERRTFTWVRPQASGRRRPGRSRATRTSCAWAE